MHVKILLFLCILLQSFLNSLFENIDYSFHYHISCPTHEFGRSSCLLLARTTLKLGIFASGSTSSIHALSKEWRMARAPITKHLRKPG